jgi:pimeloyl-ACP methyl ester carboxylesterase
MTRGSAALLATLLALPAPAARAGEARHPLDAAPSRFARMGDVRVHYKSLGEGKTALVLVHGWSCDMRVWRYQVPAFAGKVRVVLVDLPGHGKSDKPETDYTMDLFARSLDAVLKDAGVEKAALAGHSMGTPVVRQFYRLYPEKVVALIAVDGALRSFTTKPEEIDRFVGRFTGPDFEANAAKFVDSMFTPQTPEEARKLVRSIMPSAPQRVAVSAMRNTLAPAVWKEDEIKAPLLAVMAKSPFWTADYERFVRKLAARSEYRAMEGVGHFLMAEKPREFNEILAGFLKEQGVLNGDR